MISSTTVFSLKLYIFYEIWIEVILKQKAADRMQPQGYSKGAQTVFQTAQEFT
jgi:hypothetical protein